jgi:hypothetical protein
MEQQMAPAKAKREYSWTPLSCGAGVSTLVAIVSEMGIKELRN